MDAIATIGAYKRVNIGAGAGFSFKAITLANGVIDIYSYNGVYGKV